MVYLIRVLAYTSTYVNGHVMIILATESSIPDINIAVTV